MLARSRNLGIGASCCFRPISTAPPAPLVTLVPNQAEARYCVLTGATSGFFDDVHCRRQLHRRFTSRRKTRARLDRPRRREAAMIARCVASSWQCRTTRGQVGAVAVTILAGFLHRRLQVLRCRAGPRPNLELTINEAMPKADICSAANLTTRSLCRE